MSPRALLHSSRRNRRGFTLVELMVAVTGGLFVSLAVFAIARESGRFYNRESRISDATLGAVLGFERLKTDIARAGFLGTPNIQSDPHLCGDPLGDGTWPFMFRRLAALRIGIGVAGSPANATLNAAGNGLFPDSITLMGSYTAAEQFAIWNVDASSGTQYVVFLQQNTGPLARLGYATSTNQMQLLQSIFPVGAGLRIQDQSGEIQFGQIQGVGINPPQVILNQNPVLRFRQTAGALCGLKGNVTGATVNVVNFIRYQVRQPTSPALLASLYGGHPYDGNRTDLVREELNAAGNPMPNTEEVVAEYAVDLKFGITLVDTLLNNTPATLQQIDPGNPQVITWAGDLVNDVSTAGPQRVRVVRTRLTVRSQHPDRPANPGPAGLLRVGLGPGGSAPFARIRTLQADIAMHNQMTETY